MSRATHGHTRLPRPFAYRAVTCCGAAFQRLRLKRCIPAGCRSRPCMPYNPLCPTPAGLAGIRFRLFPVRSPLLRESRLMSFPRGTEMFQFPRFPSIPYGFRHRYHPITDGGLPHSETCGSMSACDSPQHFGACPVLLRPLAPRHPPCALASLTCLQAFPHGKPCRYRGHVPCESGTAASKKES